MFQVTATYGQSAKAMSDQILLLEEQEHLEGYFHYKHQLLGLTMFQTVEKCFELAYDPKTGLSSRRQAYIVENTYDFCRKCGFNPRRRATIEATAAARFRHWGRIQSIFNEDSAYLDSLGDRLMPTIRHHVPHIPSIEACVTYANVELAIKLAELLQKVLLRIRIFISLQQWKLIVDLLPSVDIEQRKDCIIFVLSQCPNTDVRRLVEAMIAELHLPDEDADNSFDVLEQSAKVGSSIFRAMRDVF